MSRDSDSTPSSCLRDTEPNYPPSSKNDFNFILTACIGNPIFCHYPKLSQGWMCRLSSEVRTLLYGSGLSLAWSFGTLAALQLHTAPKLPVHLMLHFPITCEQDPKVLELICLGRIYPNPGREIYHFSKKKYDHRGADCLPS